MFVVCLFVILLLNEPLRRDYFMPHPRVCLNCFFQNPLIRCVSDREQSNLCLFWRYSFLVNGYLMIFGGVAKTIKSLHERKHCPAKVLPSVLTRRQNSQKTYIVSYSIRLDIKNGYIFLKFYKPSDFILDDRNACNSSSLASQLLSHDKRNAEKSSHS